MKGRRNIGTTQGQGRVTLWGVWLLSRPRHISNGNDEGLGTDMDGSSNFFLFFAVFLLLY